MGVSDCSSLPQTRRLPGTGTPRGTKGKAHDESWIHTRQFHQRPQRARRRPWPQTSPRLRPRRLNFIHLILTQKETSTLLPILFIPWRPRCASSAITKHHESAPDSTADHSCRGGTSARLDSLTPINILDSCTALTPHPRNPGPRMPHH